MNLSKEQVATIVATAKKHGKIAPTWSRVDGLSVPDKRTAGVLKSVEGADIVVLIWPGRYLREEKGKRAWEFMVVKGLHLLKKGRDLTKHRVEGIAVRDNDAADYLAYEFDEDTLDGANVNYLAA